MTKRLHFHFTYISFLKIRFLLKTLSTVVKGKRGRVFFSPLGGPSCQVGFGSRNPSRAQGSERGSGIAGRMQELLTQASLYQKILLLALCSSPGQGFVFFFPVSLKEGSLR